jgi:hypothetical protein
MLTQNFIPYITQGVEEYQRTYGYKGKEIISAIGYTDGFTAVKHPKDLIKYR